MQPHMGLNEDICKRQPNNTNKAIASAGLSASSTSPMWKLIITKNVDRYLKIAHHIVGFFWPKWQYNSTIASLIHSMLFWMAFQVPWSLHRQPNKFILQCLSGSQTIDHNSHFFSIYYALFCARCTHDWNGHYVYIGSSKAFYNKGLENALIFILTYNNDADQLCRLQNITSTSFLSCLFFRLTNRRISWHKWSISWCVGFSS